MSHAIEIVVVHDDGSRHTFTRQSDDTWDLDLTGPQVGEDPNAPRITGYGQRDVVCVIEHCIDKIEDRAA